jgi:VanZ family protein
MELGQGLFLSERVSSLSDIIANTTGGLIGVGLGLLILRRGNHA